ncbi:MAG: hypothetical protein Q8Q60_03750 [Candidatus Chromulinivorax sp.]|nr:hypothetical protein [Candidatus Chromulinivorax sp.]
MKRSIGLFILCLAQSMITMATTNGTITNNSNNPVNVVFYSNANAAPTIGTGTALGKSAQNRIGLQGTIIAAGQNINFPDSTGIASMDIFYGSGISAPLHVSVSSNSNYTINPGVVWTVTLDK